MIQKLKEFYYQWKLEQKEIDQQQKINNAVNGLMKITFSEKKTFESIQIKELFVKKFNQEIAKRNINATIEVADCETYLNKNY